jgi:catechol 2,3-dioxygenase-like lactoylglutathione lyase family enzyme
VLEFAEVAAFVASTDLARSRRFYEGALGLPVERETRNASTLRAGGTIVRLTLVEQVDPASHPVLGWTVRNIEDTVRTLMTHGLAFERFDDLEQDGLGIWEAPDGARSAWFKDPDGNILALTQA